MNKKSKSKKSKSKKNKLKIKTNKILAGSVCVLLLLGVSFSLFFSLTRCGKDKNDHDDVQDNTAYNALGTNWNGYDEGDLTMELDETKHTAWVVSNNSYTAENLVIPRSIFADDIEYLIIPDGFVLSSSSVTGTIEIPSTWEFIGGIGNMGYNAKISINCPEADRVIIPESVTTLKHKSINVKNLNIPNNVTSINGFAFDGCSALTSITLPDNMTSIDNYAFSSASALTSITIPDGVKSIGSNVFNSCSALTSITIPDGVESIGDNAFNSCPALASVTIPSSVTSLGSGAFIACSSLTSITIPSSLTSIDSYTFYLCSALASITIPSSVASIGSNAFNGLSNSMVNSEKRDLYLPTTSPNATINSWISGNIILGNFTFDETYWNIQKI